jgi:hypothetical protein
VNGVKRGVARHDAERLSDGEALSGGAPHAVVEGVDLATNAIEPGCNRGGCGDGCVLEEYVDDGTDVLADLPATSPSSLTS